MASQVSTAPEATRPEAILLQRLLSLYAEETQIYKQVLQLSRRQGEIVREGGGMPEIRQVLARKKGCLDIIGRLESSELPHKREWERRRREFSPASRARLRDALTQVARLIEEILACEEKNDLTLIEQARTT